MRICIALSLFAIGMSMFGARAATAQEREALGDLSARIQFDYYGGDVRALQRDVQALKVLEVDDQDTLIQNYHLAYGQMRVAELLADKDRSGARKAAEACSSLAERFADKDPGRLPSSKRQRSDTLRGEFWAIRGACADWEARVSLQPGSTVLSMASLAGDRARERANALAPRSPRVRLLAALHVCRDAHKAGDWAVAINKLRATVELYDAADSVTAPPETTSDWQPDWGEAEALAWLGYAYLQTGDGLAARNAIERALIVVPDYAWAHTLRQRLQGKR